MLLGPMGKSHTPHSSSNIAPAVRCYDNTSSAASKLLTCYQGDLQIEGLISRDPTPIPLEDRKVEDLSLLEARERIRHLERVQRERDIRVKAEKRQFASVIADDADRTNDMIIKMESSQRKRQRVLSSAQVEVLDLTGDD